MGKGKKKGGQKEEQPPSVSGLSISDDQPSTSQSTAPAELVEEEGLGLGVGRKRKPKKKAAETVPQTSPPPDSATHVTPATKTVPEASIQEAPQTKPAEMKEESEGLGLGLGGTRKRPPRKKNTGAQPAGPPSTSVPMQPTADPVQSAPAPMQPPTTSIQPVSMAAQPSGPQPSFWGQAQPAAGRGRGSSGPGSQTQPILRPGQADAPSHGRGDGRGQQPGPSRDQIASQPIQHAPLPTQQAPVPTQPPQISKSQQLCRFTIPAKIIGRTVCFRAVKVLTNYFPMKIKPYKMHRYDVIFKPDKPKKLIPLAFTLATEKQYPKEDIAFDQMKNCYSLNSLKNIPTGERFGVHVTVTDNNGRNINFEVSFKFTGIVDLGNIVKYMTNMGSSLSPPTEEIQCIDVILRQATLKAYIRSGRQYFKRPSRPIPLGNGLEMWTGLFQSAIFTSSAFINIDVAHKGFPINQPMLHAMEREFRIDLSRPIEQQRGRDIEFFLTFIKNLKVVAKLVGNSPTAGQTREFICNGLVDPPGKITFMMDDPSGKTIKMTVADYFLLVKKYKIKYPNLNCMWVGPREKSIYYPMELLEVAYGQVVNKQLNEMQLATMVKEAATPPDERKRKIEEVVRDINYSKNTFFKQFGLEISDQFYQVDAKVLQPPSLEVGEKQPVMPRKGAWQSNRLLKPEPLSSWGFIAIESDPRNCNFENIISLLMNIGNQLGMTVASPRMTHFNVKMQDLRSILFTALEKEIRFLFIIVSTRGRDYYHMVKKMAELDVGILTQCIKEYTASRRMNPQTVKNILLKVNSKLMGINQALDGRCMPNCLRSGGVMIVGADVTHPSPEQTSVPSIAAVTASIDAKCFKYNIELSIQTPKKEMIHEFEDMMVDHFKVYKSFQNVLPKKIYVFRDGVSEGQFAEVMNSELLAIHRAYQRMTGTSAKPEVLFLLVQKRHHTRMFNTGQNCQYNVEPGTVIDTHIVHARELDFYLVSHQALKGTARPTRYHAVCNDGGIPHDEVEQLTYYLCHLYSRCMRAVSYPTPTYYAHLACLRARSLTHGQHFNNAELEKKPKRLRVLDKMLQHSRMFFV